jgi:membrane associated rhomboid family serine protease
MGIYDRQYYREQRSGTSGSPRGPGWSMNTWLIVICCTVFALDNYFVPKTPRFWQPVLVQTIVKPDSNVMPAAVFFDRSGRFREIENPLRNQQAIFERTIVDTSISPPVAVGTAVYEWMPPLSRWLHFSTSLFIMNVEFWRLIGFQFLHANLSHLLFNMLGLFFFGPIVEEYLGSKRYLAFYLLCGIFGALMYLLLNLLGISATLLLHEGVRVPGLLFSSPSTPLVGASAGIFGVLMAGAYLAPRAVVLLFFILPMQLRTMAYGLIAVALLTLIFGGNNAGGEAGHLGGAIAGWYFIRHPHHLHGFFDFLGRADPTSRHYRGGRRNRPRPGGTGNAEIDRILDKINAEGIQSLTEQEKHLLNEASRRGR